MYSNVERDDKYKESLTKFLKDTYDLEITSLREATRGFCLFGVIFIVLGVMGLMGNYAVAIPGAVFGAIALLGGISVFRNGTHSRITYFFVCTDTICMLTFGFIAFAL